MLLIDLDHSKDINDTLGHAAGDEMLIAVTERLRAATDADHLIARLDGDEFVVLARALDDRASAGALAERLCDAVRESVVLRGVTLTVGCSVGIAFGAGVFMHVATRSVLGRGLVQLGRSAGRERSDHVVTAG